MAADTMSSADADLTLDFLSIIEDMAPTTRSKKSIQPVTEAMVIEAAHNLNAATTMINLSRFGTNIPEMTPKEAIDAIHKYANREPAPNPNNDRFIDIINSVYGETLIRVFASLVSGVVQNPKNGRKSSPRLKLTVASGVTQTAGPMASTNKATEVARLPKTVYKSGPVKDAALWRKHMGIIDSNPDEEAAESAHVPDDANESDQAEETAEMAQMTDNADKGDPLEEAADTAPVHEDSNGDRPPKEANQDSPASKRESKRRSKDKPLNRGHIEMFTKAIGRVIKAAKDSAPDYSLAFNAPKGEEEIVKYFFTEELNQGKSPFTKKKTDPVEARNKWAQTKKQLFLGVAIWYELNCRIETARNADDINLHPFAMATPSPANPASVSSDNISSSDSSTIVSPTASPAPDNKAEFKITFSLWDINATRCQSTAAVNVALIRPIMRTLRAQEDDTFKPGKSAASRHNHEDKLAGLLSSHNWMPRMVETGEVMENGNETVREIIVNRDWYDALGTKQERALWLDKVLQEKKNLEAQSETKAQRDKRVNAELQAASGEDVKQEGKDIKIEGNGRGKKRKLAENDDTEDDDATIKSKGKKRKTTATPEPAHGSRRSSRAVKKTQKAVDAGNKMEDDE